MEIKFMVILMLCRAIGDAIEFRRYHLRLSNNEPVSKEERKEKNIQVWIYIATSLAFSWLVYMHTDIIEAFVVGIALMAPSLFLKMVLRSK